MRLQIQQQKIEFVNESDGSKIIKSKFYVDTDALRSVTNVGLIKHLKCILQYNSK